MGSLSSFSFGFQFPTEPMFSSAFFAPPWINGHFPLRMTSPVTCSFSYCHYLMKLGEGHGCRWGVSKTIFLTLKIFLELLTDHFLTMFLSPLFKNLSYEVIILPNPIMFSSSSLGHFAILLRICLISLTSTNLFHLSEWLCIPWWWLSKVQLLTNSL